MPFAKFCLYTFLGSFPWCLLLAYVGTVIGKNLSTLSPLFHDLDVVIIVAVVALVALYIWRHIRNDRKARAEKAAAEQQASQQNGWMQQQWGQPQQFSQGQPWQPQQQWGQPQQSPQQPPQQSWGQPQQPQRVQSPQQQPPWPPQGDNSGWGGQQR